jgi:AcrR family transcriptional regulator
LPKNSKPVLEPRKTPVQERSNASVQAIQEAAVQVLLSAGKEGLTTRKVADRAGVSVGTLYQYFPNKSAMLQAVLRNHLEGVARAIHVVCEQYKGASLDEMAIALVQEFMKAKLLHVEVSRALYQVSDDVGGAEIARKNAAGNVAAVAALLESAKENLTEDSQIVASIVLSTMAGVSRRMLEARLREGELEAMQQGLATMVRAYLQTCGTRADQ